MPENTQNTDTAADRVPSAPNKELKNLPEDFPEPFAIFMKDQVMLLWAKSSEEQTLWR